MRVASRWCGLFCLLLLLWGCAPSENYTEEQARLECAEALKQHGEDLRENVAELRISDIRYFADVKRWMCTFDEKDGGNVTIILNPWDGTFEVTRRRPSSG